MIKVFLTDIHGHLIEIGEHGNLYVSMSQHPPKENIDSFPLRQMLSLNGLGVTTDMRVNGAVTNQTFSINAVTEYDTYVKYIAFTLADAGAALNTFGALAALTNGCLFRWITPTQTVILHPNIRSSFDLVQACLFEPAFGDAAGAFRGTNVVGASEAYFPLLNFQKLGFHYGLILEKNTQDKIEFIIRDNISAGLDRFDAVAYGFIHKI